MKEMPVSETGWVKRHQEEDLVKDDVSAALQDEVLVIQDVDQPAWSSDHNLLDTQGQHEPPQVISTGSCQRIWPTYAVIG